MLTPVYCKIENFVFAAFYFDKSDSETLDQAMLKCQGKNKELAVLNSAEDLQDAISYIIKSGYVNSNSNKNCYLLDIYKRRKFLYLHRFCFKYLSFSLYCRRTQSPVFFLSEPGSISFLNTP